MILLVDEFDNCSVVNETNATIIKAVKDGILNAFRFEDDEIQQYDGDNWNAVEQNDDWADRDEDGNVT